MMKIIVSGRCGRGRRDDGPEHALGGEREGFALREPFRQLPVGVFDDDDAVVDEKAHGDEHAHHDHHVQRITAEP
jgi:hypothetical protein